MSPGSSSQSVTEGRRFRYLLAESLAGQAPPSGRGESSVRRGGRSRVRVAVIATPRCGNTWVRMMLAHVLELDQLPVHHPADLDWTRLPEHVVIQLHWPRTAYLQSLLAGAGVNVVTVSRHPFDVLVSILRFAQTEPDTIEWLWGSGGDEESLLDVDPSSEQFAQWAMSERALELLEVSSSWLADDQVAHVRYESLVQSPDVEMDRLLKHLSLPPVRPIDEAVRILTPGWVNERSGLSHAWTATTEMWKEVIPGEVAHQLSLRYGRHLHQLDLEGMSELDKDWTATRARWKELYPDPDPRLSDEDYRAEVHVLDPPLTVSSQSRFSCLVKVHNRGSVRWPDRLRHPLIRLGCRWHAMDGGGTVVLEDRYVIGRSVRPDSAIYEETSFATPTEPGRYLLEVDLVHEHIRWFECGQSFEVTVSEPRH
jgi:hypothetical protein